MLCCAVLCPAVLCCALLCCAVPCCAVLCPAVLCCALSCPALPCRAPPRPALPCPALPCPALPCPALPCPALPTIFTNGMSFIFLFLSIVCGCRLRLLCLQAEHFAPNREPMGCQLCRRALSPTWYKYVLDFCCHSLQTIRGLHYHASRNYICIPSTCNLVCAQGQLSCTLILKV